MDMMNQVFKKYLDQFIVVLVDDILVYSQTKEDHEQHLRTALQTLREHQLYTKLSKCDFWLDKVVFLSYVISKDGVSVDPAKIELVVNWERPKSASDIRSVLGLVEYYRWFR